MAGFGEIRMSLSLASATVINTVTKSNLEAERVHLAYRLKSVIEGTQNKNLDVGTGSGTVVEQRLLPRAHWLA